MAKYTDAVEWIAENDDVDLGSPEAGGFILSINLVADIFGKTPETVHNDVARKRSKEESHQ